MKEEHEGSKAEKASVTYSWHLFRLVGLTLALSDDNQSHAPNWPLPFPRSNGGVGEWAGSSAEDAGSGKPQLIHTREEDLGVESPAADPAIRLVMETH